MILKMTLQDPDTFVSWYRVDEPGENPRWQSQCGVVVQVGFNDPPVFRGYVGPDNHSIGNMTTLSAIKKAIEKEYQKNNTLSFAFEDEDSRFN